MKRRKWTSRRKPQIILEGLSGQKAMTRKEQHLQAGNQKLNFLAI